MARLHASLRDHQGMKKKTVRRYNRDVKFDPLSGRRMNKRSEKNTLLLPQLRKNNFINTIDFRRRG